MNRPIVVQHLSANDVYRIAEIDRTEHIRRICRYANGALAWEEHDFQVPRWSDADVQNLIDGLLQPELDQGGTLLGVLNCDLLVGVALLGNRWLAGYPRQLQLVFLHVSAGYRRRGVARELLDKACHLAQKKGAKSLYISATESESAVGFYQGYGAQLAPCVNQELYAREPKDIHFLLEP